MIILHTIGTVFIFVPFIAFILIYAAAKRSSGRRAFGKAADFTTFLLFFSVPLSIQALWGYSVSGIVYFVAILLAIAFLIVEWRTTKEIEVFKYVRKVWRIYFLLLSLSYFVIWGIGAVLAIIGLSAE